jgi:hypothetical protein
MSQQLLEAYETLFTSLWDRMATMLGRISTYSLMDRALFETGKESPLTNEIILRNQGLDFSVLKQKVNDLDSAILRDSLNSLIVNIVGLLAEQVGRTIADQIAKKAVIPGEHNG